MEIVLTCQIVNLDVALGKRIKVLINPFGGQGKAKTIYERQVKPVFEAAKCFMDVQCQYEFHML